MNLDIIKIALQLAYKNINVLWSKNTYELRNFDKETTVMGRILASLIYTLHFINYVDNHSPTYLSHTGSCNNVNFIVKRYGITMNLDIILIRLRLSIRKNLASPILCST
jgi:hypothetical protein